MHRICICIFMDKKKFATLKSLAAPPTVVADVMKAFLLLVYQPEDIQYCTLSTAQKAEDLIAAETEESIKVKCFDAVYVYKWTTSMVENVKASGGRKA
ncbi:uncharacterized protein LOC128166454 isoform X3 [Crassostrea angulata]|uniref:uncharacterized protein LOC128166454 isoform X3 n=1 Tax=Magallana angulata TaxID=2784310 RepID=UPI0022B1B513|nr:uncharacterized protein LOC128166454 isoform X3 [Crassostrea angulata]